MIKDILEQLAPLDAQIAALKGSGSDMEAITALNNGLIKFPGVLLFSSRDHQIVQTTANRIIEILPNGRIIDKITTYDEYLESDEMARKRTTYTVENTDDVEPEENDEEA